MSWEGEQRALAQSAFNAHAARQARAYETAFYQARQNDERAARLGHLRAALTEMLRSQRDVWGGGFDVDLAAERCLDVIAPLVRDRS